MSVRVQTSIGRAPVLEPHRDASLHRLASQCAVTQEIYRGSVPVSRAVANANFAKWVKRQLEAARAQGMNDAAIEQATGITNSTFHRWQRGQFGTTGPSAEAVRKFCDGLKLPRGEAAEILGWSTDEPTRAATQPDLPPEVQELLRRLRDPNVPNREKEFVWETLRSLIARPVKRSPTN